MLMDFLRDDNLTYDEVKIIDPEIETLISREDYDAEVGGL